MNDLQTYLDWRRRGRRADADGRGISKHLLLLIVHSRDVAKVNSKPKVTETAPHSGILFFCTHAVII